MSNIATTIEWVDERDKPNGTLWGIEYGRMLDGTDVVGFERCTDRGGWYVDLYAPERNRSPEEARRLAAALLAAVDEAELRNRTL